MGTCRTCTWAEQESGLFGQWYCTRMTERSWGQEHYVKVSPDGSCDRYTAKSTPQNSGYRGGSSSSCFLTSACVEYLGKEDDCEELTKLRAFRDNYLRKQEDGEELIKEYYQVAPLIVEKINSSSEKEKYYEYIYSNIIKCLKLIEVSDNEGTLKIYKDMVLYLKETVK